MSQFEQSVSLSFSSDFEFMDTVHVLTDEILNLVGFEEDERYWLTIAVREAITNAVKHGNRMDPDKRVGVDFSLTEDELEVVVRDSGEGFNANSVPDPRLPENLLKDKGRGIYYIRTFMDKVDYDIVEGRGTTITMVKKLPR
jgi:serine/threonine-protein kinase RsbW